MSIALSSSSLDSNHASSLTAFRQRSIRNPLESDSDLFYLDSGGCPGSVNTQITPTGRLQHSASLLAQTNPIATHASVKPTSATVEAISITTETTSSSYPPMSYPSAPASFGACPYLVAEHIGDMKNNFQNESRSATDYMRVDFNPIAESLNFVPHPSTYDVLNANTFGAWSLNGIDIESNMKSRAEFGTQSLSSCPSEEYCGHLSNGSVHPYSTTQRRLNSSGRLQDTRRLDLSAQHRDSNQSCIPTFEEPTYGASGGRLYNPKMAYNLALAAPLGANANPRSGLDLTRSTTEPNTNALLRAHPTNPSSSNAGQVLGMTVTETPMSSSNLMTPDSSTVGFLTHKFVTSSEDGEISPTPTNSSSQPRTTSRTRKAAPTLATGRRNLKNEPVDPDEADRRMKRRERNRKSAQKCRERKVQRTQELQTQVEAMQREINRLIQERDALRSEARQFVTLLQLHCPGVAVPYMSCLNENPEPHCLAMKSVTPIKVEQSQDNPAPTEWLLKPDGKVESHDEHLTAVTSSDPYAQLPSMLSMQSHLHPSRGRPAVFAFHIENALLAESNGHMPCPVSLSCEQTTHESSAVLPVSVRGLASGSSSSPGSNYDLSFATNEGPTSLCSQLDSTIEMVPTTPTSARDRTPMLINSPIHISSTQTSLANPQTPADGTISTKSEDWDRLVTQKSRSNGILERASPGLGSSSTHFKHYSGSSDSSATICCEVRGTEQQARTSRPMENTCFS